MNSHPFLLFCFVSLVMSPVLFFGIGVILWYVEQFPECRKPPRVPGDFSTVYSGLNMERKVGK